MKFEDLINEGGGDKQTDLVTAADESRSRVRGLLVSSKPAAYTGSLTWRATVHENAFSEETQQALNDAANSYKMHKSYIVVYASQLLVDARTNTQFSIAFLYPDEHGSLKHGERQINFVWFYDCPGKSQEFVEIMTDVDRRGRGPTSRHGSFRKYTTQIMANGPLVARAY